MSYVTAYRMTVAIPLSHPEALKATRTCASWCGLFLDRAPKDLGDADERYRLISYRFDSERVRTLMRQRLEKQFIQLAIDVDIDVDEYRAWAPPKKTA